MMNIAMIDTVEMEERISKYLQMKAVEKELKAKMKAFEDEVKALMGEPGKVKVGEHTISYTRKINRVLDTTTMKERIPEVYNLYLKDSPRETLTIK